MENLDKDQVSTKAFLKSVFGYFQFLGRNWQLLLIVLLIGNFYDLIKNNYTEQSKKFGGKIEFNIDLEGSGQNQLGGMAAAFGLGTATSNEGLMSSTNFPKVILSETVFKHALMTEVELFGKKDLFINFYIDSSDIKQKEWAGNWFRSPSSYGDYKFKKKKLEDFTEYENQIFNDIYIKLETDTHMELEQGTSIYILSAVLSNEELTISWLETLVKATENFYTSIKTVKTKRLIAIQEARVDSLARLLSVNDRSLSRSTFEQPNVVNPYAGMQQTRLTRDNTFLSNLYLTNLNGLESLRNLLVEQSQIFHVLNYPTLPLIPTNRSGISLRLSGLILLVATIFILTLRKSYLDIMSEGEEENGN